MQSVVETAAIQIDGGGGFQVVAQSMSGSFHPPLAKLLLRQCECEKFQHVSGGADIER
jgi:hypothetical protein